MGYADAAIALQAAIVEHQIIARATWRLRVSAPHIAEHMLPGQFVMLRIAGCNDPLIGRALAIFNRHQRDQPWSDIDVVYTVKGKFTQALSRLQKGQEVALWGPLGNAFTTEAVDRLILVAGGVGQTPMLVAAKEALGLETFGVDRPRGYARGVTLCYGARSADLLAGVEEFRSTGMQVELCTDDGSLGPAQLVTDRLSEVIERSRDQGEIMRIVCCGPEGMMHAVSRIAKENKIACQVSLETPMACGIGICFTCVARVIQPDGTWDYKRTCVDGPIFDASRLEWQ